MSRVKTPIDKLIDEVNFIPTNAQPNEEGLPYVTHEGVLKLMGIEIQVVQLSTGQRVIPQTEIDKLFSKPKE